MSNLTILDPCYHKIGGHHHAVNVRRSKSLSHLDISIRADSSLLRSDVAQDYERDILDHPFFNLGYVSDDLYATISGFSRLALDFGKQLMDLECDMLVAHTLLHFHLMGLGLRLLRSQPKKIIVSQMFSPFEGLRAKPNKKLDYFLTMLALKCLNEACMRRSHQIIIGITSEVHWNVFREARVKYGFLDFQRAPWVVGYHNSANMAQRECGLYHRTEERSRVALYLGDAKEDKGIHRIRDFLIFLNSKTSEEKNSLSKHIELYISIGSADEWLVPVVDEIQVLAHANQAMVVFKKGRLTASSFSNALVESDAIVFLYDPIKYEFRTSGVFFEALSACYHSQTSPCLILTDGSWMQREARLLKLDVVDIDINDESWMQSLLTTLVQVPMKHSDKPFDLQVVEPYVYESFATWISEQLGTTSDTLVSNSAVCKRQDVSTLIISSNYPHFSSLSGPTGFSKYINRSFHTKTELGKSEEYNELRAFLGIESATDSSLRREIDLLKSAEDMPSTILCVDGEHCGALIAKAIQSGRAPKDCKVFSWFHQPKSILRGLITDPNSFPVSGLSPICISPCQVEFFEKDLGYLKEGVTVIPHGIHRHLLNIGKRSFRSKEHSKSYPLRKSLQFLTVGAWQRDKSLLIKTARSFPNHQFLWVSSGLELTRDEQRDVSLLSNIRILSDGILNHQLFSLYHEADILFQPLIDATANNAILEAMAHGLPVITRDLESTRWYIGDKGLFYTDEKSCFEIIESMTYLDADSLQMMCLSILNKADSLDWREIAKQFHALISRDEVNCNLRVGLCSD